MKANLQALKETLSSRPPLIWAIFFILFVTGFLFFQRSDASGKPVLSDYVEYWSAGRLLLEGHNPYSQVEMMEVQRNLEATNHDPLMMWNPPWVLALVAPLSLFSYQTGQTIWLMLNLVALLWSTHCLWDILGGPARYEWCGLIATALFIPSGSALYLGQISPFLLLGLAAFLSAVRSGRYFFAGVATSFIAIKPHVLYLFWIFLFLWILRERYWRVPAGLFSALMLALFPILLYNHHIVTDYLAAITSSSGPVIWQTPTWGVAIRMLFPEGGRWLRFIPSIFGICISAWLWFHWENRFSYKCHLAPILLLSVITSSFTWLFDWVVLLPAIILLFVRFLSQQTLMRSNFYSIWVPPAFAIIYMTAARISPPSPKFETEDRAL